MKMTKKLLIKIKKSILIDLLIEQEKELEGLYKELYKKGEQKNGNPKNY